LAKAAIAASRVVRIAVRGACDFSWTANADHGKAACATLLPKPACQSPSAIKLLPLRIGYYPAREDVVADNSVAA